MHVCIWRCEHASFFVNVFHSFTYASFIYGWCGFCLLLCLFKGGLSVALQGLFVRF